MLRLLDEDRNPQKRCEKQLNNKLNSGETNRNGNMGGSVFGFEVGLTVEQCIDMDWRAKLASNVAGKVNLHACRYAIVVLR